MKSYLTTLLTFIAGFLILVGAGGCYTQLGTTHNEEPDRDDSGLYADDNQPADEYVGNGEYEDDDYYDAGYAGYGEDWHSQVRVGFNYYYPHTYWPSWGFTVAYADPWYHWYSYDPWYAYPGSYYSPYYGGYSYYGYYSPYYGGYYYPGYYYPGYYNNNVVRTRTNREFGSTRGSGTGRGVNASSGQDGTYRDAGTGDVNLPSASGRVATGGTDVRTTNKAPETGDKSRVSGSSRDTRVGTGASRTGTGVSPATRGTSSDRDKRRIYRDRGAVSGSGARDTKGTKSAPAVQAPKSKPQSSGTTRAGQGSGGTRSRGSSQPAVRPAPAPRPSSSTPRPSSGSSSSSSSSGSSRSGGQRPRP